jgi:predicted nicotinamide N-methyase
MTDSVNGSTMTNRSRAIAPTIPDRFITREETFTHGDTSLALLMPRAADELLDEEAFARDERMPYWAELWPAARALTQFLLDSAPAPATPASSPRTRGEATAKGRSSSPALITHGQSILELGCGLALPALALASRGFDVTATDHNEDAFSFIRANAARNGITPPALALLDWRDKSPALERRFNLAIAADVLYERRNVDMLAGVLPRVLAHDGRFLLADPGRRYLDTFKHTMKQSGWTVRELATVEETLTHAQREPTTSRIRLILFER